MTSDHSPAADPEEILGSLLRRPHVSFAAAGADGVLVPMPASVAVDADRILPAPPHRATMLDVLVPADSLTTVVAWEHALSTGVGFTTVHERRDPDQALSLTFLDLRPTHGVLLGALDALDSEREEAPRPATEGEWISVSRTPRTAIVRKNGFAVITAVDERTTRMLGWAAEEMVGRRSSEFIHPDDQERAIGNWLELLSTQSVQRVRLRHLRSDGTWAWLELENHYTPAEDPADAVVVTHMNDISDEMAAHEALHQQEGLLRRVAEALPLAILKLAADRSVVFANARFDALVGGEGVDRLADLEAALAPRDRTALSAAVAAALTDGRGGELHVVLRRPGVDERRICAIGAIPLTGQGGAPRVLLSFTDVTTQVRMQEELTRRATTDALTGAANRETTLAALERALTDPGDALTAVLFVDLDGFKPINDTYGHDTGDELLRLTASRLAGLVRPDDVVGRIGGDEFLVVSRGHERSESALAMAQRVREALGEPAVLRHGPVTVRASIGVACGRSGGDASALVREADQAMYRAKQQGRGAPVLAGR